MYTAIDSLLGGYIRDEKFKLKPSPVDVIELIEEFSRISISDPLIEILLFSIIQGAKLHLNFKDPVRLAMETSDYLGEVFVGLLDKAKL